jgi:hypothetical protein
MMRIEIDWANGCYNYLPTQATAESRRLNLLERTVFRDRECLAKKQREWDLDREMEQSEVNQQLIKETIKTAKEGEEERN